MSHQSPWPSEAIRQRLCDGDTLWRLCRPKPKDNPSRAAREHILERTIIDVLLEHHPRENVRHERPLGETLNISDARYFTSCRVDVSLYAGSL